MWGLISPPAQDLEKPNCSAPSLAVRLSSSSLVPLFLVGSKLGFDHQRARLCPQTKAELAVHLLILQKPEPRPLATTGCGSVRRSGWAQCPLSPSHPMPLTHLCLGCSWVQVTHGHGIWETRGTEACNADPGPAEGSGQCNLVARTTVGGGGGKAQLPLRDGEPWAGREAPWEGADEAGASGARMSFLQRLGPLLIAELSPLCVSKIQGPSASSHLKGP